MKKGSDPKEFLQKVPDAINDPGFTIEFRAQLWNALVFGDIGDWKGRELLYRLEYNKKQNHFHCNNYTHKANTCGWVTICEALEDSKCMKFIYNMEEKYKGRTFIPIQLLKKEMEIYLEFNKPPIN